MSISKATHGNDIKAGELICLGFQGPELPRWVEDFAGRFGLGAVILFDYDCQTKTFENNIRSPEQVRELCAAIHALPSQPLVLIDQEGGKVRRLKEALGFKPLPSALQFAKLSLTEQERIAEESFSEMRALGIDYTLAPVVDLNFNPASPGLGAVERCFSADPNVVRDVVEVLNGAAHRAGLGLCLKHYPGLGGAKVDSHHDFTDVSDSLNDEQLELFYELSQGLFGDAILVSHGLVRQWDARLPVSVSERGIGELRKHCPTSWIMTDDMQMQGLLKLLGLKDACIQGLRAGVDLLLIGNNLFRATPEEFTDIAQTLTSAIGSDEALMRNYQASLRRTRLRKAEFR